MCDFQNNCNETILYFPIENDNTEYLSNVFSTISTKGSKPLLTYAVYDIFYL